MTPQAARARQLSRIAGGVVAAVGLLVLAGWALDVGALKSVLPGLVSMKVNTAIGLVAAGAALLAARDRPRPAARAAALLLLALGAATLAEHAADVDLGIDELLVDDPQPSPAMERPGRPAAATAACLLLAGAAILLLDAAWGRLFPAEPLALAVVLLALFTLVGYAFGERALYRIGATSMALHTAAAMLVLGLGILAARPDRGFMLRITGGDVGAGLARRLLPVMMLLPVGIAIASNQLSRRGAIDRELALALSGYGGMVAFAAVGIWGTGWLSRIDRGRRAAEAELRWSEERFRATFEQAAVGIAHVAPDGRWLRFNARICAIVGYGPDELRALTFQDITHPDDLDADLGLVARVMAGEIATYTMEKRYFRKGGSIVWIDLTVSLVRHPDGSPDYFIAVVEDISARKEAEARLAALTAELERRVADRTAELQAANRELEAFAYSVSHDLRAPLRAIAGFSRILRDEHAAELSAEARRHLERVGAGAERMGVLIDDLLRFSRLGRQPLTPADVDVRELVASVVEELQEERRGRNVAIQVGELPACRADRALLRQVFSNLLGNALKFTRGRDPARIEVGARGDPHETVYYVKDDGAGFDMAYASRLFGVFQRLHRAEEYEGNGVGLALVQRIVHKHGGRVWAESAAGAGATFYFTLRGDAE